MQDINIPVVDVCLECGPALSRMNDEYNVPILGTCSSEVDALRLAFGVLTSFRVI